MRLCSVCMGAFDPYFALFCFGPFSSKAGAAGLPGASHFGCGKGDLRDGPLLSHNYRSANRQICAIRNLSLFAFPCSCRFFSHKSCGFPIFPQRTGTCLDASTGRARRASLYALNACRSETQDMSSDVKPFRSAPKLCSSVKVSGTQGS